MLLWNIRGWLGKRAELDKITSNYDICFLTETKSKESDRINIRDFDIYINNNYNQGAGGAGGVAILIRRSIKRTVIDMSHCRGFFDVLGIKIQGEKYCLTLVCLYRRPGRFCTRES